MIKVNSKYFKLVSVVTNFVQLFLFGEERLIVQILIIENFKTKVFTRVMVYAKLAMNFLENGSWQESKWIEKQFTKFIEPFLVMNVTVVDIWDRGFIALQIIAQK